MPVNYKRCLKVILFPVFLLVALFYFWNPSSSSGVDIQPRQDSPIQKLINEKIQNIKSDYSDITYKIKENAARCVVCQYNHCFLYIYNASYYPYQLILFNFPNSHLAQNACVCHVGEETFHLPFSDLLFPRIWAHNLQQAFLEMQPNPDGVKHQRAEEYNHFLRR